MNNLPSSWINVKLGDVVNYADTLKAEPSKLLEGTWILELEDIEKKTSKLIKKALFPERQSKSTKNKFEKGDVLYGKLRPYLDKVIIATEPGYCTTEIIPIKSGRHLNNRFLFYCLKRKEFLDYVSEVSHGLSMPRLGTRQGQEAPLVLAPLNEQARIANKLDSLLGKVDAAQARLEKIPSLLKRFRQAVLVAATSGDLTKEWREEHITTQPQKIDFDELWGVEYKKQNRTFKPIKITTSDDSSIELPTFWRSTKLGQVCDVYVGATPSRKETAYWGGDINWVSSSEVSFCRIRSTKESITADGLKKTSTNIHPSGTVMLAMIGQGKTRGQAAILDIEACHNQNTAALRVLPDYLLPEYLYFFLWCQYEQTRKIGGGNNQQALNKSTVQGMPFSYPPFAEQKEIVRRVESLFTLADVVEKQYIETKKRIDHLTQSFLAKAFRGELVPQDPSDEPAAELLKRIQSERKQQANSKIRRNTTSTKIFSNKTNLINLENKKTMKPNELPENYLADLLTQLGGEIDAETLWKKSDLSIDDFYARLKKEIQAGQIVDNNNSPDPALRKLKKIE